MPAVNMKWNVEKVIIDEWQFVNLYDSEIGNETSIGPFTEIGLAKIGERCKIGSHVNICPRTIIKNDVFIANGVQFCNVKFPKAFESQKDKLNGPRVEDKATIGAGAIILPGVTIGEGAFVTAGSVVTMDVLPYTVVGGNPAHVIASKKQREWMENYNMRQIDAKEVLAYWEKYQKLEDLNKRLSEKEAATYEFGFPEDR